MSACTAARIGAVTEGLSHLSPVQTGRGQPWSRFALKASFPINPALSSSLFTKTKNWKATGIILATSQPYVVKIIGTVMLQFHSSNRAMFEWTVTMVQIPRTAWRGKFKTFFSAHITSQCQASTSSNVWAGYLSHLIHFAHNILLPLLLALLCSDWADIDAFASPPLEDPSKGKQLSFWFWATLHIMGTLMKNI